MRSAVESLETCFLRFENVKIWPVSESISAVVCAMDEKFLKRNGTIEISGSCGREIGGLGDV